jgi:DNA-binding beta-propeller fold protein YncE
MGLVTGIAVDPKDHIWVVHDISQSPEGTDRRAVPAPPVIEFDPEGNVVQAWGGPGDGYVWPGQPHGISVDHEDNVWIGGDADHQDTHILKFTRAGKFLLSIGVPGKFGGSNDTTSLANPAQVRVDPQTGDIFVADGEMNKRIIVFDKSGTYKRHWGAYGGKPDDRTVRYNPNTPPSRQFGHRSVHCLRFGSDGLLYVCDRSNNRIQVFQKDGTFVKETHIARDTTANNGSIWDLAMSPDGKLVYVGDATNQKVWILLRDRLEIVGSFGEKGYPGGQVERVHSMEIDSKGNVYTGPPLRRFVPKAN